MAWQREGESRLPHVGAVKSWAERSFKGLSPWDLEKKRLSLLLRLGVLDRMLMEAGQETLLNPGQAAHWEFTYNQIRGTQSHAGRPTTSSQSPSPLWIEKGQSVVTQMTDSATGPTE